MASSSSSSSSSSAAGGRALDPFIDLPEYLSEPELSVHESDDEPDVIPPDIRLSPGDYVFGMDVHPTRNLLLIGLSTGVEKTYVYEVERCELLQENTHHTDCIRDVAFSLDGAAYYTVGSDKRICGRDVETNKVFFDCTRSKHKTPVNKIMMCTQRNYVTGDDIGNILLWDCRQPKACAYIHENIDQITDFDYDPGRSVCLASSLDRGYTVLDMRKFCDISYSRRLKRCELESIAIMAEGHQIVCGTSTGEIFTWDWGEWNLKPKGRIKGHSEDLQCMLPVSQDHVLTGSADGAVRLIRLFPPELREFEYTVATIADHDLVVDFTIETLRVTPDDRWLAFTSHDACVYWADLSGIQDKLYPPDQFMQKAADKEAKRMHKKKLSKLQKGTVKKLVIGQKRARSESGGREGSVQEGEDSDKDEVDDDFEDDGKDAAAGSGAKLAAASGRTIEDDDNDDTDDSGEDSELESDDSSEGGGSDEDEFHFVGSTKIDRRSSKEKSKNPEKGKMLRKQKRLKHGFQCGKFNDIRREFFRNLS